jgi:hypothetical protein
MPGRDHVREPPICAANVDVAYAACDDTDQGDLRERPSAGGHSRTRSRTCYFRFPTCP